MESRTGQLPRGSKSASSFSHSHHWAKSGRKRMEEVNVSSNHVGSLQIWGNLGLMEVFIRNRLWEQKHNALHQKSGFQCRKKIVKVKSQHLFPVLMCCFGGFLIFFVLFIQQSSWTQLSFATIEMPPGGSLKIYFLMTLRRRSRNRITCLIIFIWCYAPFNLHCQTYILLQHCCPTMPMGKCKGLWEGKPRMRERTDLCQSGSNCPKDHIVCGSPCCHFPQATLYIFPIGENWNVSGRSR